jgi:hypothetical protein
MADFERDGEPIFVTADQIGKCPRCTLPVFPSDEFCPYCNHQLKSFSVNAFREKRVLKVTGGRRVPHPDANNVGVGISASAPPLIKKSKEMR